MRRAHVGHFLGSVRGPLCLRGGLVGLRSGLRERLPGLTREGMRAIVNIVH